MTNVLSHLPISPDCVSHILAMTERCRAMRGRIARRDLNKRDERLGTVTKITKHVTQVKLDSLINSH